MPRPTYRELEFPGIKVAARPDAGWNGTRDRGETPALAALRSLREQVALPAEVTAPRL